MAAYLAHTDSSIFEKKKKLFGKKKQFDSEWKTGTELKH